MKTVELCCILIATALDHHRQYRAKLLFKTIAEGVETIEKSVIDLVE
ncbi:MAG: hypothetical protein F6K36_24095 [Symploca sp. SIO3C6]|uniref:Uncharacterized protein n=1 Tax=Symploca sp. SIO1C4 TaxID=2607765 RepID=A0A6B3NCD1_9CYAN|nr:hypothetical protein [Symploca sp. SIO3C6]NER28585.1 hypothetical protein [Symploca sp. SIO1C4]